MVSLHCGKNIGNLTSGSKVFCEPLRLQQVLKPIRKQQALRSRTLLCQWRLAQRLDSNAEIQSPAMLQQNELL